MKGGAPDPKRKKRKFKRGLGFYSHFTEVLSIDIALVSNLVLMLIILIMKKATERA